MGWGWGAEINIRVPIQMEVWQWELLRLHRKLLKHSQGRIECALNLSCTNPGRGALRGLRRAITAEKCQKESRVRSVQFKIEVTIQTEVSWWELKSSYCKLRRIVRGVWIGNHQSSQRRFRRA